MLNASKFVSQLAFLGLENKVLYLNDAGPLTKGSLQKKEKVGRVGLKKRKQ